jgi:hypothetical protein
VSNNQCLLGWFEEFATEVDPAFTDWCEVVTGYVEVKVRVVPV